MSNNKGLRIGSYRIQPLGLIVIILVLLIAVAAVVVFAVNPGDVKYTLFPTPSPTPSPTPEPTPTPTPSPSPTPTPAPTPRSATIRSLGEISAETDILKSVKQDDGSYDFSEVFSYVSDVMGNADYTVADVEGSMGGTVSVSGETYLHTPASMISALKDCGVDMLNLANDHSLDGNLKDLLATIQNCQSTGMEYVGAAASADEKKTAKVVDINGIKVGFVAYTESLNVPIKKLSSGSLQYGLNYIYKTYCNAKSDIQACRDAGAEVIVAYVSWGKVGSQDLTDNQKSLAKQLAAYGADVIIGYNPHVTQPVYWLENTDKDGNVTKRTLCLFATGNFLCASRDQYVDSGLIFQFTLQEKDDLSGIEVVSPCYIPTYVWAIPTADENADTSTDETIPADAIVDEETDDTTDETEDTADAADSDTQTATVAATERPSVIQFALDENGKEITVSDKKEETSADTSDENTGDEDVSTAATATSTLKDNISGTSEYTYRVLAVGQWLESAPEGMNYTQYSRLKEVWAEIQSVLGTDVASVAAE